MASLIQRVAQMAFRVFSNDVKDMSDGVFRESIENLRSLLNRVTAKDVNFDRSLVLNEVPISEQDGVAPVTYIHLWDSDIFTMGIFVLKRGARLPLHDHPEMFGFCKVIHGSVRVRSYSQLGRIRARGSGTLVKLQELGVLRETIKHVDQVVSEGDSCVLLTPSEGNLHEITAECGPAAFLDILAPPYDEERGTRLCHYFQEAGQIVGGDDRNVWLEQVSQPRDYWCDSAVYSGPKLTPNVVESSGCSCHLH